MSLRIRSTSAISFSSTRSSKSAVVETSSITDIQSLDLETEDQRKVNQYVLGEVLGEGATGMVYRATSGGQQFAIKEISKSRIRKRHRSLKPRSKIAALSGGGDDPLQVIKNEIAILKRVNHPNIIQLYEVLDDSQQDCLYLVFELCSRGPSQQQVSMSERCEPLPLETIRNFFIQAFLALEYLHAIGIVHRDVKMDNLLVAEDGTLKLSDFGISHYFHTAAASDDASLSNQEVSRNKSVGSPAFIAPEIIQSRHGFGDTATTDSSVDFRLTDLWALGVTLFCWVSGQLPFRGDNIMELNEAILHKDLSTEFEALVDHDLIQLLKSLLERDVSKRWRHEDIRLCEWVNNAGQIQLPSVADNLDDTVLPNATPTSNNMNESNNKSTSARWIWNTSRNLVNRLHKARNVRQKSTLPTVDD